MLVVSLAFAVSPAAAAGTTRRRPSLQIINGSNATIQVFWINKSGERILNATVPPGKQSSIQTTLGHRFAIVPMPPDRGPERIVSVEVPIQTVRYEFEDERGIPEIYTQRVFVKEYPIVATEQTSPYALREAAFLIEQMLSKRPDVLDAMTRSGSRFCIHAWNEFTTDLPEFAWLSDERVPEHPELAGKDYWDARARGLGGSEHDPFCSCGEENLLGYEGDPYASECILIHEFAHNIHLRGLLNVDPTFDDRLKKTYHTALASGLWKGKYASVNHHEYFAEGVQSWFSNNRENDHDHNHVNTREELKAYDPGLASICHEIFGETELVYVKPRERLRDHLEGFDLTSAPHFVWPERLKLANERIVQKAVERSNKE